MYVSEKIVSQEPVIETLDHHEIDQIMSQYDKEYGYRKLTGFFHYLIAGIAIVFSIFQIGSSWFSTMPAQLLRAIHLVFVLVLAFLLYPATRSMSRKKMHWSDVVLGALSAAVVGYIVVNYQALILRAGDYTSLDVIVGICGIILVLEACRRVVGVPFLVLIGVFLLYAYFGPYMPGFLNHRGYSIERIVTHIFYTTEGILGIPLGVCATFIFLFILFGAFLEKTGIGKFFIDLANAVAGFAAGGPAKVAVLISALEGTVSGSSISNTVGSGSFTIPMMKSLGYKPEFSAAVEAAASTGGQIMPPIMGAAAFLMAESLGMPYIELAKAAVIPALLYFVGVWIMVHLEAKKLGLKGMSRDQLPSLWKVLKEQGHLFLPLVAIIYFLAEGTTPMHAALYGIGFSIIASMLRKNTRMTFRDFMDALEMGGRNIIAVAVACAAVGIIIGVTTLTGLGLKMASGLISLSGGIKILTLFFTMIASLIMGMGLPTTATYLITATITAPAIVQLGVPVLAAHMFVFYFGIVADITPPVALAAYAGAAIAKSNPFKTGITATKLAIAGFIIPYIFCYNPALLLVDTTPWQVVQIIVTSLIGMIGIGAAMENYLVTKTNLWERILLFVSGLMLVDPSLITDIIGLAIIGGVWFYQLRTAKRVREESLAA